MQVDALFESIDALRVQMVELAVAQGSLTHPDVVAISQQLDVLIVRAQLFSNQKKSTAWELIA